MNKDGKMKELMVSMLSYWVILLAMVLGGAALIYIFWLRDTMM